MTETLIDHVRKHVDPKRYYSNLYPDMRWPDGGTEARMVCVFHEDKAPSLHFNPETGAFYCHGCSAGGKSIVSFHAKLHNTTKTEAAEQIYHQFVRPVVPVGKVRKWHRDLKQAPTYVSYLKKERLLNEETVSKYQLGYGMLGRVTFPVMNEFGLCVNVKGYDPLWKTRKQKIGKMLNYRDDKDKREFGSPVELYPFSAMAWARQEGYVVVCEGEFDTLFLISLGIPAVTSTGGSKSWPVHRNDEFHKLDVYIAYDNDKDGMRYDRKVVLKNIKRVARRVFRLKIPTRVNGRPVKDVLEWGKADPAMRLRKGWKRVMRKASLLLENSEEMLQHGVAVKVTLEQATKSDWYGKRLQLDGLVTGKDTAPYLLPKKARVTCARTCDKCPLLEFEGEYKEVNIDPSDPSVLAMVDSPEDRIKALMAKRCGVGYGRDCNVRVEVMHTFNIERLLLIPSLDENSAYCQRHCYYLGHGLQSNRAYEFEGTTLPDPRDQHSTHLLDKARPVQDEIENFQMTPALMKALNVFRPREDEDVFDFMVKLSDWQATYVTKIRRRPDLHIAVDLVYHSVSGFEFNGEFQKRGMLDVLIIGDTRCGKGYVAEGLKRYYGLGEVASGENCSFAGLIGGVQQTAKRFFITWGLIPVNHNRAVIIDEASALSQDEIGKMSRVRSEGVAEIIKIVRESTRANTRLCWVSNPRGGKKMEDYDEGVQAVKELIGANEDISRFDFVLSVATNEVESEVINKVSTEDVSVRVDAQKYPPELCRKLILWAWSRRPDQVKFSGDAVSAIIEQSIIFGNTYSSNIPIVQVENVRVKIAKVAAAVAARTFSTGTSGEFVVVRKKHVDAACRFMREAYNKPSLAYDLFSKRIISNSKMKQSEDVTLDKLFAQLGAQRAMTMQGLMSMHRITVDALSDFVGDPITTRELIIDLVKLNAMTRLEASQFYIKNPAFGKWLRAHTTRGAK